MACGLFTTLALTATLLGQQGLRVESQIESPKAGVCREDSVEVTASGKPNGLVLLKNDRGEEVFEARVRVPTVLFYDYGHAANDGHSHDRGGAVPEKQATFLFKFPRTARTLEATKIELRTFDGTYAQSATLQARVMPTLKVGLK